MSGAAVFRVTHASGMREIVKVDRRDSPNSLAREHAVLRYLRGRFLAPEPLGLGDIDDHVYLRMSAIPGIDASEAELTARPAELVMALARALRQLHALPVSDCPFDRRMTTLLAEAAARLTAGQVDLGDFDVAVQPQRLLEELCATQPDTDDLVVAHGDYCHPNVLFEPHTLALTGLVDLGRFGAAHRYLDLGIAARSIRRNLGERWLTPFFDAYGVQPDWKWIKYFQNLDEFF